MVPLALTVALPLVGCWVITTVAGLRVPSASVSLATTAMVVVAPSATVAVSLTATGASLTAVTVRVTVAVLLVAPVLSVTV